MVNLPRVPVGGVRVGDSLGAGSLILIPSAFLLTAFRGFFWGGGVAVALHLPARVHEDPALGPADESSADSALGTYLRLRLPESTHHLQSQEWLKRSCIVHVVAYTRMNIQEGIYQLMGIALPGSFPL
jgi:hypothetical protein